MLRPICPRRNNFRIRLARSRTLKTTSPRFNRGLVLPNPDSRAFFSALPLRTRLCVIFFLLFPCVLTSLPHYLLLLAMYRIQRPPKRVQRLVRRRQNLFLIPVRVLFQPPAPRRAMRLVRFFMYLEVRQPLRLRHSFPTRRSSDLRRGDFRHLRFVSVECRHRLRHRPVPANLTKLVHHGLRPRQSRAARNVVLAHSHRRRKIPPQLRMRPRWTLLFRQVLPDQPLQRTLRPRRQHPQMLRERLHVSVILRRVKLQPLPAQLPRLPILIKRMLQQTLLRNRRINPRQQFGVSHCGSPRGPRGTIVALAPHPISCRALYQTLVCFACSAATPGGVLPCESICLSKATQ